MQTRVSKFSVILIMFFLTGCHSGTFSQQSEGTVKSLSSDTESSASQNNSDNNNDKKSSSDAQGVDEPIAINGTYLACISAPIDADTSQIFCGWHEEDDFVRGLSREQFDFEVRDAIGRSYIYSYDPLTGLLSFRILNKQQDQTQVSFTLKSDAGEKSDRGSLSKRLAWGDAHKDRLIPPANPLAIDVGSFDVLVGEQLQFELSGGQTPYQAIYSSELGQFDLQAGLYSAANQEISGTINIYDSAGRFLHISVSVIERLSLTLSESYHLLAETFALPFRGGLEPFEFILVSGAGSIDAKNKTFTTDSAAEGRSVVQITDARGDSVDLTIFTQSSGVSKAIALINPGCEMSLDNGWQVVSGDAAEWQCGVGGAINIQEGSAYFYAGNQGADRIGQIDEIKQDVNVADLASHIDADLQGFQLSLKVGGLGTGEDAGRIHIEFWNSDFTSMLGIRSSPNIIAADNWPNFILGDIAPVGTRNLRIRLQSVHNTGPTSDAYFDDLQLVSYPQ